MNKDYIISEVEKIYDEAMTKANSIYETSKNAGGKVRQINGDLVERIFSKVVDLTFQLNNLSVKVTGKKQDSEKITSKNGGFINVSVDVHARSEKINFFSECKTYLDKCYLDRASSDLKHFKKGSKNICLIVSLENAVAKNAETYFLDEGYVDKIFYLVDGKRNSSKPIWKKEHYKPLNKSRVLDLINFIEDNLTKNQ
jgi:hypothetical protein